MKTFKRFIITALLLVFAVTMTDITMMSHPVVTQAATLKLSSSTLTLEVGKTKTLKVTGTKSKITWSSSKKAVATVSSKGLVTAKATGKATITASIAGKKLTCAVTVKKPVNPFIKNAPFDAVEQTIGNISLVMPADWDMNTIPVSQEEIVVNMTPKDKTLTSLVQIQISSLGDQTMTYKALKSEVTATLTLDFFKESYKAQLGDFPFEITDFEQSELEASFGKILKIEYNVKSDAVNLKQCVYSFLIDNYCIAASTTDINDLDLEAMLEYVISSLTVN